MKLSAFILACASAKDRIVIDSNEFASLINTFKQQSSILWLGDVPHSEPRRLPRQLCAQPGLPILDFRQSTWSRDWAKATRVPPPKLRLVRKHPRGRADAVRLLCWSTRSSSQESARFFILLDLIKSLIRTSKERQQETVDLNSAITTSVASLSKHILPKSACRSTTYVESAQHTSGKNTTLSPATSTASQSPSTSQAGMQIHLTQASPRWRWKVFTSPHFT